MMDEGLLLQSALRGQEEGCFYKEVTWMGQPRRELLRGPEWEGNPFLLHCSKAYGLLLSPDEERQSPEVKRLCEDPV